MPPRDYAAGPRAGFTLVELLLVSTMLGMLMLAVWSLFGMYTRLFETGQSKAEQTQLVRALLTQLTDDLHSAMQDPIPGHPVQPRGPVAIRRFGLFGTSTELRLDVLQITPFAESLAPKTNASAGGPGPGVREPLRAPELRTVYYRFEPNNVVASERADARTGDPSRDQPGLSRRELDFETPYSPEETNGPDASMSLGTGLFDSASGSEDSLLVVDPNDDSVMLAPEVVGCRFRYFSGSSWSSQWNSLQRKSLPVAVEVFLQVSTLDDRQEQYRQESAELDGTATETPAVTQRAAARAPYSTYRLVIDIPGAPMHTAPKKTRKTAMSKLKQRAATRYRPRPVPKNRPARVDLSDQWMRAEP